MRRALDYAVPATLAAVALYVFFKFKNAGAAALKTGLEKGQIVGEKISGAIAKYTLPDYDTSPTIIDVTQGAQSTCPKGYKLTYGQARGWYCLKVK